MAPSIHTGKIQRERVLAFFIARLGAWISLTEILDLRISQFGARILELRRMGFDIENKLERVDGVTHSWYRLKAGPTAEPDRLAKAHEWISNARVEPAEPESLFGDLRPEGRYPD